MSIEQNIPKVAEAITDRIQTALKEKERILVAIDGRCASGKTTLAAYLQEKLSCAVIHMDDFFLRPEQRTEERMEEPGGNVDYERVLEEVLIPLKKGEAVSYRPYDCHSQAFKPPVNIKKNAITVVEGSYSAHPQLWEYYDLHVFLDVEKATQIERIRRRNGDEAVAQFENRWIPLEEKYFAAYRIKEKCKGLQF